MSKDLVELDITHAPKGNVYAFPSFRLDTDGYKKDRSLSWTPSVGYGPCRLWTSSPAEPIRSWEVESRPGRDLGVALSTDSINSGATRAPGPHTAHFIYLLSLLPPAGFQLPAHVLGSSRGSRVQSQGTVPPGPTTR